jgi:BlaI family transcriptional regulator, penicillinase repressor
MKQKAPRITETEWEIMKVLWASNPATASEVIDALSKNDRDWHPKTVKTLLGRLVAKKALGYEKAGRAYVYQPLVSEKECAGAASQSFLDRVFGGSLQPLLAHFVERKKLSAREIQELKNILDGK